MKSNHQAIYNLLMKQTNALAAQKSTEPAAQEQIRLNCETLMRLADTIRADDPDRIADEHRRSMEYLARRDPDEWRSPSASPSDQG